MDPLTCICQTNHGNQGSFGGHIVQILYLNKDRYGAYHGAGVQPRTATTVKRHSVPNRMPPLSAPAFVSNTVGTATL